MKKAKNINRVDSETYKCLRMLGVVTHTSHPSPRETETGGLCESEAYLIYVRSDKPARAKKVA